MNHNDVSRSDGLGLFFILTFLLTLPAYALIALTTRGVILSPEIGFAFVPVATLAPVAAAAILAYGRGGWSAVKALLLRVVDFRKITDKRWYLAIVLVPTILMLLGLGLSKLTGQVLVPAAFPLLAAPLVFVALFGGAMCEELGWMGHAYDRMQEKWSAFKSAVVLGLIITIWHLPQYAFLIDDPALLAAQLLFPLALRIWVIWLYNNTGKSIFAVTVLHTLFNVGYAVLSVNLVTTTALSLGVALTLPLLCGPDFKWPSIPASD